MLFATHHIDSTIPYLVHSNEMCSDHVTAVPHWSKYLQAYSVNGYTYYKPVTTTTTKIHRPAPVHEACQNSITITYKVIFKCTYPEQFA